MEVLSPSPDVRRLAIAWLVNCGEGYGIQRAVTTAATTARDRGHRVLILSISEGRMTSASREAGLPTEVLGGTPVVAFSGSLISRVRQLVHDAAATRRLVGLVADRLRRDRFDVLHWVLPNLVGLGSRAATRAGVLPVWEMPNIIGDGYPFGINRRLYQRVLRRNRVVVLANSRYTSVTLAGGGVSPVVLPHLTDERRFVPEQVPQKGRQELGIPVDAVVLGVFARLTPSKGQDVVVRAVGRLPDDVRRPHVLLIGGPLPSPYADELRSIARELGIGNNLHILPPVTDVERYFGVLDMALNTRVDPEPFGLSVIEAMLMRKPVIVHALGGPAETVVDGVTGYHYSPATPQALAAVLARALCERERWPAMGDAGRTRALEHYSASTLHKRYITLVRDTLTQRRGGTTYSGSMRNSVPSASSVRT